MDDSTGREFGDLAGTVWSTGGDARLRPIIYWFCLNALTLLIWSFASAGSSAHCRAGRSGRRRRCSSSRSFLGAERSDLAVTLPNSAILLGIQGPAFTIAPALGGMYQGVRGIAPRPTVMLAAGVAMMLLVSRAAFEVQGVLLATGLPALPGGAASGGFS